MGELSVASPSGRHLRYHSGKHNFPETSCDFVHKSFEGLSGTSELEWHLHELERSKSRGYRRFWYVGFLSVD